MRVVWLLAALALGGCANAGVQDLEARLGTLIGASEDDLVRRVGVPARMHETEGRRYLAFVQHWPDFAFFPGTGFYQGAYGYRYRRGPELVDRHCEVIFEVAQGRVAGFALRGSACGWNDWPVIAPA